MKMQKLNTVLPYIIILIYVFLACINLGHPGINSDEILFGNAALGLVNNTSHLSIKIGNLPILLMPYIGAFKAYLYYPIFKIFGVNYLSIRLPMIFLTSISLFVIYKFVSLSFRNSFIALISLLLIATDCTLIALTRTDIGPIAIEYFLKVSCIYLFIKFMESKQLKYLYLMPLILFLGVFNKLNFIWLINALYFSAFVFFFSDIKSFYFGASKLTKVKFLGSIALSLCICFAYYLTLSNHFIMLRAYFVKTFTLDYFVERLKFMYDITQGNFTGKWFYSYQYNDWSNHAKIGFLPSNTLTIYSKYLFGIALLLIVAGVLIILYRSIKNRKIMQNDKYFLFFFSLIIVQLIQTFPTTNALHCWHYYTIYPFITICLVYVISIFMEKKLLKVATLFVFFISNLNGYAQFVTSFDNKVPKGVWSKAIDELIEFAQNSDAKFVSVTWGADDQLVTFTQKDSYLQGFTYSDDIFAGQELFTNTPKARTYFYDTFIKDRPFDKTFYIVSWEQNVWFKNYKIFMSVLKEKKLKAEIIKNIKEKDQTIYSIIRLRPISDERQ